MSAPTVSLGDSVLQDLRKLFATYKQMGDKTFSQLDETQLNWRPDEESNSIAVIVQHISGNLLSRWTDFMTTDGEKPWRNRDGEFEEAGRRKAEILARWEEGWARLSRALESITAEELLKVITIRGEPHTVLQALHRSLTHTAYHVGQVAYAGKALKGRDWATLSIPRNRSKESTPRS
jgi:hypothetical protein